MIPADSRRIRIVHFVTGGGSGATRVALDIALAQCRVADFEPHLILRNKGRRAASNSPSHGCTAGDGTCSRCRARARLALRLQLASKP